MGRLLELDAPPTAVFAANDHMALGTLEALKRAGRRAAVEGFDGIPEAEEAGLTTVRQPLADMARRAGETLRRWLETGRTPERKTTRLSGELVVRESTGV